MLSADDPLPSVPERVLVAGVSGAGKTTLARRLARLWNLRHVEIDGLFHGPEWTPRPEFLDDVRAFAFHKWTERFPALQERLPHLTIVRLRHPRETRRWMRAQAEASGTSIAPPKRRSLDR